MSEIIHEGWHDQILERLERLENEMFKGGFWERPQPPPPAQIEHPTAVATNIVWWDEPPVLGSKVHVRFHYQCGCGTEHEGVVRVLQMTTLRNFEHLVTCDQPGHTNVVTKVSFPKRGQQ